MFREKAQTRKTGCGCEGAVCTATAAVAVGSAAKAAFDNVAKAMAGSAAKAEAV